MLDRNLLGFWAEIGIDASCELSLIRSILEDRRENNEYRYVSHGVLNPGRSSIISADPRRYLGWETCANEYYNWWDSDGGNAGIEPPANHWIRQIMGSLGKCKIL